MDNKINKINDYIIQSNKILVICGAGISTNSGIPDFRSSNGIFDIIKIKYGVKEPQEIFELSEFLNNPERFYKIFKFYIQLIKSAKTTNTHNFIKELENSNKLLSCYTQNIDCLESSINIKKCYQVHGSISDLYCMKCNKKYTYEYIYQNINNNFDINETINYNCNKCYGIIKPNIIFYGEDAKYIKSYHYDIEDCDLVIIIGTSLKVNPIANIKKLLNPYIPIVVINKEKIDNFDEKEYNITYLLGDCDSITERLMCKNE